MAEMPSVPAPPTSPRPRDSKATTTLCAGSEDDATEQSMPAYNAEAAAAARCPASSSGRSASVSCSSSACWATSSEGAPAHARTRRPESSSARPKAAGWPRSQKPPGKYGVPAPRFADTVMRNRAGTCVVLAGEAAPSRHTTSATRLAASKSGRPEAPRSRGTTKKVFSVLPLRAASSTSKRLRTTPTEMKSTPAAASSKRLKPATTSEAGVASGV
mmetsp:Transcript_140069/g.390434  ORF Transcript_140069/g.390434 Transcript_140069/m.390434 type:complete len:216 (-) Transcript_140069:302-949(-)